MVTTKRWTALKGKVRVKEEKEKVVKVRREKAKANQALHAGHVVLLITRHSIVRRERAKVKQRRAKEKEWIVMLQDLEKAPPDGVGVLTKRRRSVLGTE